MNRLLTKESILLDYKQEIDLTKGDRLSVELASDIVQFANSFGGELIIGVSEDRGQGSFNVVGCENRDGIRQFIHNRVLPLIYPQTINPDIDIERIDGKDVLVIKVAALAEGVGFVVSRENDSLKAPYRTDFGKKFMSASEVEKRIGDSSRRIFLKLSALNASSPKIKLSSPFLIALNNGGLEEYGNKFEFTISKLEDNHLTMLVNHSLNFNIPYSQIEDAWDLGFNEIAMILKLRVIYRREPLSIRLLR
jgi:hypothetical protein